MPDQQAEQPRREPSVERRVFRAEPERDADNAPETAGSTELHEAHEHGDGEPPSPPAEAGLSEIVLWLKTQLEAVGARAARIRYRVILLLVLLVAVAAAALGAGLLAQSDAFWTAAALVFSASFCGLIAYAANELGVFAETAQLLSREAGARVTSPGDVAVGFVSESALRAKVAYEIAVRMHHERLLFGDLIDGHALGLARAEEELALIGAKERHAASARMLAALCLDPELDRMDIAQAEECLVKAAGWGDLGAARDLGRWHAQNPELVHEREWWLRYADDGSVLAAYIAGRVLDEQRPADEERQLRERDEVLKGDCLPSLQIEL